MHRYHCAFQVPPQATHHHHRVIFSPIAKLTPRLKWNIGKTFTKVNRGKD